MSAFARAVSPRILTSVDAYSRLSSAQQLAFGRTTAASISLLAQLSVPGERSSPRSAVNSLEVSLGGRGVGRADLGLVFGIEVVPGGSYLLAPEVGDPAGAPALASAGGRRPAGHRRWTWLTNPRRCRYALFCSKRWAGTAHTPNRCSWDRAGLAQEPAIMPVGVGGLPAPNEYCPSTLV